MNAGWTHREQHCILQPPSVSSIMFIFIPFYSFLCSCPFSCIVTGSYIPIFIESILFVCLEIMLVNFHIFAFYFYFLHSFQTLFVSLFLWHTTLFVSPCVLISVAHIFIYVSLCPYFRGTHLYLCFLVSLFLWHTSLVISLCVLILWHTSLFMSPCVLISVHTQILSVFNSNIILYFMTTYAIWAIIISILANMIKHILSACICFVYNKSVNINYRLFSNSTLAPILTL
jgi:hypothetical protein